MICWWVFIAVAGALKWIEIQSTGVEKKRKTTVAYFIFLFFFFFFIDARKLTKQPHPMNTNNNYNCQEICAQMFDLCLVYVRQILVDFYTAKYIWIRNFETEQTTLIVSILFWLVILDWNFLADRFGLNFWKIQMKKRHLKMSIHQKKKTEHL